MSSSLILVRTGRSSRSRLGRQAAALDSAELAQRGDPLRRVTEEPAEDEVVVLAEPRGGAVVPRARRGEADGEAAAVEVLDRPELGMDERHRLAAAQCALVPDGGRGVADDGRRHAALL